MKLEKISYNNNFEKKDVINFIEKNFLKFDESCDYTIIVKDDLEKIIATASKTNNILKCFVIDKEFRGQGISSLLITNILNKIYDEGYKSSFVFTKQENLKFFINAGYKEIASTEKVSLLEIGINSIEKTLQFVKEKYQIDEKEKAMLIMNCNPFTLGHQYIIEKASKENLEVLVFVVEEDSSMFPFKIRFDLIKKGCEYLSNVKIVAGTEYIISKATFPTYFMKKDDDFLMDYTLLDATITAKYFCTYLNIKKRYIGEEPFCKVTEKYNEAITKVFSSYGIEVIKIPRKKNGELEISATQVRNILTSDKVYFIELEKILPKITIDFFRSEEGKKLLDKIKNLSVGEFHE